MRIGKEKKILFALIIGLIYVLPHILFIFEEGENYHLFFKTDEESELYAARVREIYDGHYLNSDPFIYENKRKPYARTFLSEFLVGALGKISGLSIDNLFILGDFIFPIIIFYLLFYFLNLLVRSSSLSLVGSMTILLTEMPYFLILLLKSKLPTTFLDFSRSVSPQFHYIFFVACFIFIYRSLIYSKTIDILLSGLFLGSLCYSYPYFWMYIFAGLCVLFLYFLFSKDFKQVKIISFIIMEALIISVPFWINWLRLIKLPFYNEIITRTAFQRSRHIFIFKKYILAWIIFILLYKNKDFNFFFLLSFLIGGLLCTNQQLFTGWIFEPSHWYHYVDKQMAVIVGVVLLERLLKNTRFREGFTRLFLTVGLTFSISIGMITQIYSYEVDKYIQRQQQDLYEAFVWLQNNTQKEDVVLASSTVSLLIPAHTHNNVYWSSYIFEYANRDEEILERFFLLARLLGMDENDVIDYILISKEKGHSDFFGVRYEKPPYKKSSRDIKVNLPNELYSYIIERYWAFKKEDINRLLGRFKIDYLFFSQYERLMSKGRFKKESFLNKVYDSNGIRIYKIIK